MVHVNDSLITDNIGHAIINSALCFPCTNGDYDDNDDELIILQQLLRLNI